MNNITINIKTRNNADARRMGERQYKIPGCECIRHTGGKNVVLESSDRAKTVAWLEGSYMVEDFAVRCLA